MAEELLKVVCGQCDGKMRVRRAGEAVVCPHCKSHMRVPVNAESGSQLELESGSGALARVSSRSGILKSSDSAPVQSVPVRSAATSTKSVQPASSVTPQPARDTGGVVSWKLFVLVASYASAVTLVLAWLLFMNRSHQLESLPDLKPLTEGQLQFVDFDAPLPPEHSLALRESRRFGDVRVTPLRVTREPIEFVHYENAADPLTATDPVLKLWLRFENLASDVAFPPYDTTLMSRRIDSQGDGYQGKANTFLSRVGQPRTPDNVFLNYDHPVDGEWDIVGQNAGAVQPGTDCTTFVACREEGGLEVATSEPGDLVWRVQFRKGVNRTSRNGVTTLLDVVFSTTDIGKQ